MSPSKDKTRFRACQLSLIPKPLKDEACFRVVFLGCGPNLSLDMKFYMHIIPYRKT